METIILKRDGTKDIRFTGEQIASTNDRYFHGEEQTRWTEYELYRTDTGRYVLATVQVSCWDGESNSHYATVHDTADEVIKDITEGESTYTDLIKNFLKEAAEADSAFKDATVEDI